jgi:large subunit ribosomal protein L25
MISLQYSERKAKEDLALLRKTGSLPGVFYGKKEQSTPVLVAMSDFVKVWRQAGESEVVVLTAKESGKTVNALIHEVSVNPLTGVPLHVDFYVFEKGKKLEVDVPLEFIGVSPAVKDLGGNLIKVLHEIKLLSTPESIPHAIEVDIASLVDLDSVILAKDINLPNGVELIEEEDTVVASVSGPKGEEKEEESATIDLSSIEVEKKGKKEEEVSE